MEDKSINVYICTYNEEKNIQECIYCIKQNYISRIFVVDASPNDLTASISEKCGATVIKAPKGLAGQRQIAVNHCKSEYIMFVDADDRLQRNCIKTLYDDIKKNNYDAVQARLRVLNPKTYWQKGMDSNLEYCISLPGQTNMVGRPALYKTSILKTVGIDVSFNNIGNEDAAISIRLEKLGFKQGIGNGICYRYHPSTFKENFKAWKKYGLGDANLIRRYPEKKNNVIKHILYVYPVKRTRVLFENGKGIYSGYTIGIGLVRFFYMIKELIINKRR